MKRLLGHGVLLLVIMLVSGCIFDSDDDKDVKKGTVSGKITMIVTGDPVANVRVYLVNMDAKIDTVDYANNQKAFVDSVVTNTSGEYVFGNVVPGRYGVVPVCGDSTKVYKFAITAGSDSCMFSMNGDSYTVNFTAEKTDLPGSVDYQLRLKVYFKHGGITKWSVWRRHWIGFIPYYLTEVCAYCEDHNTVLNIVSQAGFTCVLYTQENAWKYLVNYTDDNGVSKTTEFYIYLPINTPGGVKTVYNFNCITDTLTFISSDN